MRFIISFAISIVIVFEVVIRLSIQDLYSKCIEKDHTPFEIRAQYCSCQKDAVISARYQVLAVIINHVINKKDEKELPNDNSIPGFAQCDIIRDDSVKNIIEEKLERDVINNLSKQISSQNKHYLKEIYIQDYHIKVHPNKLYRYSVDVTAVISSSFFGVTENKTYIGAIYYKDNAESESLIAEWKQSGSTFDPSKLIEGISQFLKD